MSMFTVKGYGDVEPLRWDTDDDSEPEDVPQKVQRTRVRELQLAAKRKRKLGDDDDDLVLLDLDATADGGEQGSQCDDAYDGARGCKLRIPAPCESSLPAAAKPVVLDPAVQQQLLKAQAEMAELRRRAQEAAEISPPSSEDDEPGPSGKCPVVEEQQHPAADEAKITLKVKSVAKPEGLKMRIGVSQPFSRLYTAYEQAGRNEGWLPADATVTLLFDGDKVHPDATPASLDLEDEEVIDARWA